MKDLVKQYLDRGISRRHFLSGLGALGVTASSADAMARSLTPFLSPPQNANAESAPSWMKTMRGTGGALLAAQLKAAGIEFVFFNPSSGAAPFFDALVDEPGMHVIEAVQEGCCAAMADGYAKASGKIPFVICARPGFPNAMTQVFNTWKDQVPLLIAVDYVAKDQLGEDAFEDSDHMEVAAQPVTKWYWVAASAESIPEVTRRAVKFATTPPYAPVFLAFPEDMLAEEVTASIMDQSKFHVSMKLRPDATLVEQTARLLLDAKNPIIYLGDEITLCGAQKETLELAELLGIPVARAGARWSKPFPTRHPLYLGTYLPDTRYPGPADVLLNLGGRLPWGAHLKTSQKLIEIRTDPANIARSNPDEVAMVGDLKLALQDLIAALRGMATDARLKQIGESRSAKTAEYTTKMRDSYQSIARELWDHSPMNHVRMGVELEKSMEKDAIFVADLDSGRTMETVMSFGGTDKQHFTTAGAALGWGVPAALGVKLGQPDRQVVSVVGDGAFLSCGPTPLWSFARYKVPVTTIVCNNHSYNNERNRIWNTGGKQFQAGRDMTCYLGDPDLDYAKMSEGCGVEAEVVKDPNTFQAALERAKRATADGRPYLLDVHIEREGIGAASNWYPDYSVAARRQRKV